MKFKQLDYLTIKEYLILIFIFSFVLYYLLKSSFHQMKKDYQFKISIFIEMNFYFSLIKLFLIFQDYLFF